MIELNLCEGRGGSGGVRGGQEKLGVWMKGDGSSDEDEVVGEGVAIGCS